MDKRLNRVKFEMIDIKYKNYSGVYVIYIKRNTRTAENNGFYKCLIGK